MRYQNISKFIKKNKRLLIGSSTDGTQWISDGAAAYPVIGMPRMNEREMLTFLGFQENDPITVSPLSDITSFSDVTKDEELIETFGPYLIDKSGAELKALYTSAGALLINSAYLVPVFSHCGDGELTFWLRMTRERTPYIAVKKGLYLIAVILPIRTWQDDNDTAEIYSRLAELVMVANDNFSPTEDKEQA